jgi:hypothetical protein
MPGPARRIFMPARRADSAWPRDRPVRWAGVVGNLSWFVIGTAAGLLQLALAIPVLAVSRGWLGTLLALVWGGLTLFAAWAWLFGRWRIVVAPALTVVALLLVASLPGEGS